MIKVNFPPKSLKKKTYLLLQFMSNMHWMYGNGTYEVYMLYHNNNKTCTVSSFMIVFQYNLKWGVHAWEGLRILYFKFM